MLTEERVAEVRKLAEKLLQEDPTSPVYGLGCVIGELVNEARSPDANRYHQALGAKWMCEAIVRWCRTTLRQNRNAQSFADDIELKWADDAFWRK